MYCNTAANTWYLLSSLEQIQQILLPPNQVFAVYWSKYSHYALVLAYFTDRCSYCLEGPGALKKCKGCDKEPCTQGQAGWPAYLHHFCVAKAAGSMADDLKHSHVCHSSTRVSRAPPPVP